jgi:hypothetical protein
MTQKLSEYLAVRGDYSDGSRRATIPITFLSNLDVYCPIIGPIATNADTCEVCPKWTDTYLYSTINLCWEYLSLIRLNIFNKM